MNTFETEYRKIRRNYTQYIRRHGLKGSYTPIEIPKFKSPFEVTRLKSAYHKLKSETSKIKPKAINPSESIEDILSGEIEEPEVIRKRKKSSSKQKPRKKHGASAIKTSSPALSLPSRPSGTREPQEIRKEINEREFEEDRISPTREEYRRLRSQYLGYIRRHQLEGAGYNPIPKEPANHESFQRLQEEFDYVKNLQRPRPYDNTIRDYQKLRSNYLSFLRRWKLTSENRIPPANASEEDARNLELYTKFLKEYDLDEYEAKSKVDISKLTPRDIAELKDEYEQLKDEFKRFKSNLKQEGLDIQKDFFRHVANPQTIESDFEEGLPDIPRPTRFEIDETEREFEQPLEGEKPAEPLQVNSEPGDLEKEFEEELPPYQKDIILDNIARDIGSPGSKEWEAFYEVKNAIDNWEPLAEWDDFWKQKKFEDKSIAERIFYGAIWRDGDEDVARRCEARASEVIHYVDKILYGSDGKHSKGPSIDECITLFSAIVNGRTLTQEEAKQAEDLIELEFYEDID